MSFLYLPQVVNDGLTGLLKDVVTGANATLYGGSTLTGQAKFRNDFQRIPGTDILAFRAAPAWSNLPYTIDPDNTSFEGGTTGTWVAQNATISAVDDSTMHGSKAMRIAASDANAGAYLDLSSVTSNAQYTAEMLVRAANPSAVGKSVALQLIGDASGATSGTAVTLDYTPKLVTVTKTFSGDITRTARLLCASSEDGDIIHADAFMLVSGSTIPAFTEASNTNAYATIPKPIQAGEPFSVLVFVWTPWAGDDSVGHWIFSTGVGANSVNMQKWTNNRLEFEVRDNNNNSRYTQIILNSVNWPAGSFHAITASATASNTQYLAVDGTLGTTIGTGARESSLQSTMFIGSNPSSAYHFNGLIWLAFYRGAWTAEECKEISYTAKQRLDNSLGRLDIPKNYPVDHSPRFSAVDTLVGG